MFNPTSTCGALAAQQPCTSHGLELRWLYSHDACIISDLEGHFSNTSWTGTRWRKVAGATWPLTASLHIATPRASSCGQPMAMGQNPIPPVNIPNPTKIGSKMGGEFTYQPKWYHWCRLSSGHSMPGLNWASKHETSTEGFPWVQDPIFQSQAQLGPPVERLQ